MSHATPYLVTIDHLLDEDERLVWRTAREFCERAIAPIVEQHYEKGTFPRELIKSSPRWVSSARRSRATAAPA